MVFEKLRPGAAVPFGDRKTLIAGTAPPAPEPPPPENVLERTASGPWTDLGLTLPVFVGYHLGVIFLPVRNAADWVTQELVSLANNSPVQYSLLTLSIGALFVGTLVIMGRGHTLHWNRFALIATEAIVYAIAMRLVGGYVVTKLALVPGGEETRSVFAGFVMSLGAGFYEELAFRVGLYALGWRALRLFVAMQTPLKKGALLIGWALFAAFVFSAWHYIGPLGDAFELRSFVYRWVCGLVFTAIFALRGFAPAVWTHMIYDIWVLVF
jgi:hypothetical protein